MAFCGKNLAVEIQRKVNRATAGYLFSRRDFARFAFCKVTGTGATIVSLVATLIANVQMRTARTV
jgi:hypothetical protein